MALHPRSLLSTNWREKLQVTNKVEITNEIKRTIKLNQETQKE